MLFFFFTKFLVNAWSQIFYGFITSGYFGLLDKFVSTPSYTQRRSQKSTPKRRNIGQKNQIDIIKYLIL